MSLSCMSGGPYFQCQVSLEETEEKVDTRRRERLGGMQPQAEECLGAPEAGIGKEGYSSRALAESWLAT